MTPTCSSSEDVNFDSSPASEQGSLPGLTDERDHRFTLAELWPYFDRYGQQYGIDGRIVAAVAYQESGFKNYIVHNDGTGHGLFGLDDGGLRPDFEQWSGIAVGRGANAISIPPEKQIEYASMALARYATRFGGDVWAATRAWHRGQGLMNDAAGLNYERLIRGLVTTLFG